MKWVGCSYHNRHHAASESPRESPSATLSVSQSISGWVCILMTTSRSRGCWKTLYMYAEDMLWVWSGWGAAIITDIMLQVRARKNLLVLVPSTATFLAGNVLFCRVFPSLQLQTWRVVSATCRRHVFGHVAKMLCRPGGRNTWHLKTCRDMSSNVCNNVIAIWAQTRKLYELRYSYVWADLNLSPVIDIWYELGMSGLFFHVLCRGDMPFLEKLADIWQCRQHFGDMSATFPAKATLSVRPSIYQVEVASIWLPAASCCRRCWNTLYIYEVDLLWVWSVWGAVIIEK